MPTDKMDIKLEGDLAALSNTSEQVCKEILIEKGFTKCTVEVQAVGKKGDNYVANVKRFIAQQDDVNDGKPFKMIVKLAPNMEQLREMMFTGIAFNNEIIVYNDLFPKYDEIQEAANIPVKERLKHPKCYGTSSDAPNEVILLEDICESGFKILDRFVSMTDEQARIALKDLAKIHALSFVLKNQHQQFYEKMKNSLSNLWAETKNFEEMQQFAIQLENDAIKMLKSEEYKRKIKGLVTNLPKISLALHNKDINSKHSAIVQGDCWTNNMMFKIENVSPIEVMMLDYQLSRIASPAADILYFTFNCVNYETRKQHFNDWIEYYYKCFEDFLFNFNLKANFVYPRDKLDADLQLNSKNSFAVAVMISNMLVRESDDVIDFKDNPDVFSNIDAFSVDEMRDVVAERYNEKVQGLLQSCIDFGYL